jgi:hypothetical protein
MRWPSVLNRRSTSRPLKGVSYRTDIHGRTVTVTGDLEARMAMPEQSSNETHGFTMNVLRQGVDLPKPTFTPEQPLPSAPDIEW